MNNQLENNNSYLGFTDNKTPLQKSKIECCLDKVFRYSNKIMARKDAMLQDLRDGKKPEIKTEITSSGRNKNSYRLVWDNLYNEITKTEYDFCMYLINNSLISEESVNTFIENEKEKRRIDQEEQKKAEEAAARKKELEEYEKESFEKWLHVMSEMYEGTTKGNLVEKIYLDIYNEFKYPYNAYEILVCIDNIEKSLCKEELKGRLHTGNKASRKVFMCVTGLRLPNTNKETMEFIEKLQKSDYEGMVNYRLRKKSERKESENSQKEVFYISKYNPEKEEVIYEQVDGIAMEKHGIKLFIHKTNTNKVGITSVESGLKIAEGDTLTLAKQKLTKAFEKIGKDTMNRKIMEFVSRYGRSPYYKDQEGKEE